ncbi:MAG: sigma-54 interaction domain-containing protein [Caulobacteraceae bacterium]
MEELNYCFSAILNSINEGVLLSDADGIIRFYNNQLKDFEGLNPNEIIGKHITEVYKVNAANSEHLTVLKAKSPIIDRYQRYQTVQNKEVHLVASTYPILKSGKIISTYSISRNLSKVKELLENTQLLQKNFSPIQENLTVDIPKNNTRYTLDSIIGNSPQIKKLIEKARRATHVLSSILIYGETGTGKELIVQGIHNENSITRNYPFVAINCAAIPESLLESLLFGTVQGAFTGSRNASGLIEQAYHGTLFLDEINSMPLGLQAKLLRVLQENKYRKLGEKDIKAAFIKYDCPGNVRELEHIIESSVTMIDGETTIMPEHLPVGLVSLVHPQKRSGTAPLSEVLLKAEEKAILDTLEEYHRNISKSAAALGISRQNLQYRMRKLNMNKDKPQ